MDRLALLERMIHKDFKELPLLVTPDKLNQRMLTYSAVRLTDQTYVTMANKKSMNLKHINIVDPTFSKNNLGKSISELNASRIKQGVKLQTKNVSKIYHQARIAQMSQQQNGSEVLLKGLLNMFQVTFECIGAHPIMSLLLP